MIYITNEQDELNTLNVHDIVEIQSGSKKYLSYYDGNELIPISLPKLKVKGLFTEHHAYQYLFTQHPEITVLSVMGSAGGGKSFMTLGVALESILVKETQQKIMIIRELVPSTNWKSGYLPGNYDTKIRLTFDAIFDTIDALVRKSRLFKGDAETVIDNLLSSNAIELTTLEFFRGRSLSDTIVIADDAQNLDIHSLKLLITRLGDNSRLILTGDLSQIDYHKMQGEPGLTYLDNVMKGSKYYSSVEFSHSECRNPMIKEFLAREKEYLNEIGHK